MLKSSNYCKYCKINIQSIGNFNTYTSPFEIFHICQNCEDNNSDKTHTYSIIWQFLDKEIEKFIK